MSLGASRSNAMFQGQNLAQLEAAKRGNMFMGIGGVASETGKEPKKMSNDPKGMNAMNLARLPQAPFGMPGMSGMQGLMPGHPALSNPFYAGAGMQGQTGLTMMTPGLLGGGFNAQPFPQQVGQQHPQQLPHVGARPQPQHLQQHLPQRGSGQQQPLQQHGSQSTQLQQLQRTQPGGQPQPQHQQQPQQQQQQQQQPQQQQPQAQHTQQPQPQTSQQQPSQTVSTHATSAEASSSAAKKPEQKEVCRRTHAQPTPHTPSHAAAGAAARQLAGVHRPGVGAEILLQRADAREAVGAARRVRRASRKV